MTDITNTHLEAAILDQKVAGMFPDTPYAFVAVAAEGGWQLGIAVANERGYNPIAGKVFKQHAEALQWSEGLNEHIGLTKDAAMDIVISTMAGRRVAVRA